MRCSGFEVIISATVSFFYLFRGSHIQGKSDLCFIRSYYCQTRGPNMPLELKTVLFRWQVGIIAHVLASMPMFLLQVLEPPRVVMIKLGRICNGFLWDRAGGSKGIHWASWECTCYPLHESGLGFRSFLDMSPSFTCKLWWQL